MQVVSRIDHVTILSDDAESVFGALRRALGVPVLWPFMDLGPVRMGSLYVGNCALQVMTLDGAENGPTRLGGLAFASEHAPWEMADRLARLNIKHTPPVHVALAAAHGLEWTGLHVGGLIDGQPKSRYLGRWFGGASPYARRVSHGIERQAAQPGRLSRFHRPIKDQMISVTHEHGEEPRRRLARAKAAFAESGGGTLGLSGIISAEMSMRRWSGRDRIWSKFLGIKVSPGSTAFLSSGPALRFTEGEADRISGITFKTRAADNAMPGKAKRMRFPDAVLKAVDLPFFLQTSAC